MTGCSWRTTHTPPGPLTGVVASGVTVLVLAAAFVLSALDPPWAWIVYPLGFGGLLPVALGVAGRYERRGKSAHPSLGGASSGRATEETVLEALRRRYAHGEIDEVEFEHRAELLLRTGTVPDAREYLDSRNR